MPEFVLKLHSAYYRQGFFNVPVSYDRYVRSDDGPINLVIRETGQTISGKVNRQANRNGTARVMGGTSLKHYFQSNYDEGDKIKVEFLDIQTMRIG